VLGQADYGWPDRETGAGPAPEPAHPQPDLLHLHGLRFFGHHGVSAAERRAGGEFAVDLEVEADTARAMVTDDVADTVNYVDLYGVVRTIVEEGEFHLLEAMASGKPIVASDIPGYRWVVNHGVEGLLVPPKDERALTASMVRLLSEPELMARMSLAGKMRAEEFSWDKVAERVLAYYGQVLASRPLERVQKRSRWRRAASGITNLLSR